MQIRVHADIMFAYLRNNNLLISYICTSQLIPNYTRERGKTPILESKRV